MFHVSMRDTGKGVGRDDGLESNLGLCICGMQRRAGVLLIPGEPPERSVFALREVEQGMDHHVCVTGSITIPTNCLSEDMNV